MQPLIPYFDRVSIQAGPLTLSGFGLMVVAGFFVGAEISRRKLARDGLDPSIITPLLSWLAVGVYVGGHIGHLLASHPESFVGEPQRFAHLLATLAGGELPQAADLPQLLRVWDGLSSVGGFVACTLIMVWYFPRHNLRILPYGDAVMFGFATSWALARLGCFSAHDHPGIETHFWLGVQGICPSAYGDPRVACHDTGLYEAILAAAIAVGFAIKDRVPRPPGYFLMLGCLWYAPGRFLLDFLRHPATESRYSGLASGQYGAILLVLIGLCLLWQQRRATAFG